MTIEHDHEIEWPNGMGVTTCSKAYADAHFARDMLSDGGRINLNDMSPENYERYCRLDQDMLTMQASGHIGKSFRF